MGDGGPAAWFLLFPPLPSSPVPSPPSSLSSPPSRFSVDVVPPAPLRQARAWDLSRQTTQLRPFPQDRGVPWSPRGCPRIDSVCGSDSRVPVRSVPVRSAGQADQRGAGRLSSPTPCQRRAPWPGRKLGSSPKTGCPGTPPWNACRSQLRPEPEEVRVGVWGHPRQTCQRRPRI